MPEPPVRIKASDLAKYTQNEPPERIPAGEINNWLDKPVFAPEQFGVKENVGPEAQINTPRDLLLKALRSVDPILSGLGVLAGTAVGAPLGPGGAAAGGVLGGMGTSMATRHAIEGLTGQPEPSLPARLGFAEPGGILDRILGASGDVALSYTGEKLVNASMPPVKRTLLEALNFIHPPKPNTTFARYPNIPASYSQMTGGTGKAVESIFAPGMKEEQIVASNAAAKKEAAGMINQLAGRGGDEFIDLYDLLNQYKGNISGAADDLMRRSNVRANIAKNIAKLNPVNVPGALPGMPTKRVDGPVYMNDAVRMAEMIDANFKAKYGLQSPVDMLKIVENQEKPLLLTVTQILGYAHRNKQGQVITDAAGNVSKAVPFEAAWDVKKAAADLGNYTSRFISTKEGKFRNLSEAVDEGIEDSMVRYWQNGGPAALKAYQQTKAIVSKRHELYQQGDVIQKIITPGTDLDAKMLGELTKNPQALGRAIAAGRDRKTIQAAELQRIIQGAWDNEGKIFDQKKLLNAWNDPAKQAVYRKLYNASQRADIDNLITVLRDVSQKQNSSGRYSMVFQLGKSAVFAGTGLVTLGLLSGGMSPYEVAGLSVIGGTIAMNSFAKNVLLNPKVARQVALGLKTPATSNQARLIGHTVLGALKGTGILLQKQDGTSVPATIQPDGSIKLDKQP